MRGNQSNQSASKAKEKNQSPNASPEKSIIDQNYLNPSPQPIHPNKNCNKKIF